MFDIGWTELLVIGVVALIVVGPKDLPAMFRELGRFSARIKGMARDFQRAMEDAADDTGVRDVAKDLRKATSPRQMGLDKLKDAADRFDKWEPGKPQRAIGSDTAKLSAERAEAARRARDATADAATRRMAAEGQAAAPEMAEAHGGADDDLRPMAEQNDDVSEAASYDAATSRREAAAAARADTAPAPETPRTATTGPQGDGADGQDQSKS
ncbi:twin-arginine translocase subunit TatB [Mesobaculum littorinae]|uniref:Sec-independent protein translocase protein TatB n=1 Tax=Mesobaculum littorinae TaxID=2486419 RepID=A0A438ALP7_9RHOB|nr:Sec-independent protein translocase protein TatB [Mesobaculum littorinae]RVV99781.1 twin-arginine translocase subunit TatB [Mesobaculum littorinae]